MSEVTLTNQDSADPVAAIEGILTASEETITETVNTEGEETHDEEITAEAEEVEETEAEEVAEDEPQEVDSSEEIQLEVSELADYLGVDSDLVSVTDTGDFKMQVTVDGKKSEATLDELIKGYQFEAHNHRRAEKLSEDRKAFEAEQSTVKEQAAQETAQASQLLQFAQQQVLTDYQGIDWNSLRENNPAEYAALQQDYNTRINQINQAIGGVDAQAQQAQQAAYVERTGKEMQMLLDKLPAWNDQATASKEQADITQYLISNDFSQDEVAQTIDHRAIVLARKAMLYDQMTAAGDVKKEAAKKKVIKLPKVTKPGATKDKAQVAAEAKKARTQKLKANGGHVNDVAALLYDRM